MWEQFKGAIISFGYEMAKKLFPELEALVILGLLVTFLLTGGFTGFMVTFIAKQIFKSIK